MRAMAKCATVAALGPSAWALGASAGAGPAIVVAQGVARASAAPLVYMYEYVVDDADVDGRCRNHLLDGVAVTVYLAHRPKGSSTTGSPTAGGSWVRGVSSAPSFRP